jgi:hypothetical protein
MLRAHLLKRGVRQVEPRGVHFGPLAEFTLSRRRRQYSLLCGSERACERASASDYWNYTARLLACASFVSLRAAGPAQAREKAM